MNFVTEIDTVNFVTGCLGKDEVNIPRNLNREKWEEINIKKDINYEQLHLRELDVPKKSATLAINVGFINS